MIKEMLQNALLADPTYLQFSILGHQLGLLRHVRRAMAGMNRAAGCLIEHPAFQCLFGPTMKSLQLPLKTTGVKLRVPSAED